MTTKTLRNTFLAALLVATVCLLGGTLSQAGKGGGGGKPGGGGGGSTPTYAIVDLGGFDDGSFVQSEAIALNNPDEQGTVQVVGASLPASRSWEAISWHVSAAGSVSSLGLGTLGGPVSWARGVNDFGDIAGLSQPSPGATGRAVAWYESSLGNVVGPIDLTGTGSHAAGVNNFGQIVGFTTGIETRGLLWERAVDGNGNPIFNTTDLGAFHPQDINDFGVMVGWVDGSLEFGAAVAQFDVLGELHVVLLGFLPGDVSSTAYAINNWGDVVGESTSISDGKFFPRAFLARADENGNYGDLIPLGMLSGDKTSRARDINDAGQVVGDSGGSHGFLWQNGAMKNVNSLLPSNSNWDIRRASAINQAGQIVGFGDIKLSRKVTEQHGFLLSPPAP
jgi:probable HAF family extracellular repeat protein